MSKFIGINTFKHKDNGFTETVSGFTWLWALLFGPIYWAVNGVWRHVVISIVLAICTFGVSAFIYPFFARGIMQSFYLRNGWTPVKTKAVK